VPGEILEGKRLYMAPLKGITDSLFRRVYDRHFDGIDGAVAPFINPQSKPRYPNKLIKDLLPENSDVTPLVPQVLNTDTEGFIALADRLFDLGYEEINWNLGCPVRMVAGKRRGSGLLPYPETILSLLDHIVPRIKQRLSIKMRLGYYSPDEALTLLPMLEPYPLAEIIIHARLGTQLYQGAVDLDQFDRCRSASTHRLVYNGDLTSPEDFTRLAQRFDSIERWMIGRGLLINPFLPSQIKGIEISPSERLERLRRFHEDLYISRKRRLSGPGHLLGRMKQVWIYFIGAFPGKEMLLKKVTRADSEKSFLAAVEKIME
ncbi:MAG: tRNA-dihydrouridine synthase family protein, partial [Desulfofustis sp.]